MPTLKWADADEIGLHLHEAHPDTDPLTLRFTDLREMVLSLAGFDDDPIAELLSILLTTIRLPIKAFAQTACEAILRRIAEPETDVWQIIIDTELVIRESTTGFLH